MRAIDLLSILEKQWISDYFTDLHIINNEVVGFYKTRVVKYKNINNEDVGYLFPTTFKMINGIIYTRMVFGSVDRSFILPTSDGMQYAARFATKLEVVGVNSHLYKLLTANQYIIQDIEPIVADHGLFIKAFMSIIEELDNLGFPFMRIANSNSLVI